MPADLYSLIDAALPPSPEAFIAARVHRLLSHDLTLRAVLGESIILLRNPEQIDLTPGTKLLIAPNLSGEPIETTGYRELRRVEVLLSLQWEEIGWNPVHDGPSPDPDFTSPGKGTEAILAYCWYLVAHPGNRGLKETVNGEQVQTVSPGETNRAVFNHEPSQLDNGMWIFGNLMVLRFTVRVDVRTGQIEDIAYAQ